MSVSRRLTIVLLATTGAFSAFAQNPVQVQVQTPVPVAIRPDYTLGPNDQILVRSNVEELSERPFRVDSEGIITFPLINRVPVSGLTVQALEIELTNRLREFYQQPQVNIMITGFRDEPVSFIGAFAKPGVYPLSGGRRLADMLVVAGGFLPNASRRLRVTRRLEYGVIPLPTAVRDDVNGTSSVVINLESLLTEINSDQDIELEPYDRITVDQSQPVYVGGEVVRPAPIDLVGRDSITVIQALVQAGGFSTLAKRGKVRIERPVEGTALLSPIELDVEDILAGRANDFPLYPNDILWVPRVSSFQALLPGMTSQLIASLPYIIISTILR